MRLKWWILAFLALGVGVVISGVGSGQGAMGSCMGKSTPSAPSSPSRGDPVSSLRSPLDARDTAGAKQRFIEVLRRRFNRQLEESHKPGRWDFWSEGSTRYPLENGKQALLISFRRVWPRGQEGLLVLGNIEGRNTIVYGYWRVPAGIDDIHLMDMKGAGHFLYTVSFDTTSKRRRLIYHHLLRFDGRAIRVAWSYTLTYDIADKDSYVPVRVTFRDEDGDGRREVRIRIPKDTPRLWKRRWALFSWAPARGRFEPLRALAFTAVSRHKPDWAAFALLEAIRLKSVRDAARFTVDRPGCRTAETLYNQLTAGGFRQTGPPRLVEPVAPLRARRAAAVVPLEKPGQAVRYQARLELVRVGANLNGWRVCRARLFRL